MEVVDYVYVPARQFAKDSYHLIRRCTKPDRRGNIFDDDDVKIL